MNSILRNIGGSGSLEPTSKPSTNSENTLDGDAKTLSTESERLVPRQIPDEQIQFFRCARCNRVFSASKCPECGQEPMNRDKIKNDRTNPKDVIGVTKLPLRFIPPSSLAFLARVMELGATKYGSMNWRQNDVRATIYFEAALRHIWSALDGEELDPESGQPHAAHAMACMAILLDAKATGNLIDDRFAPGAFGRLVQEMISGEKK